MQRAWSQSPDCHHLCMILAAISTRSAVPKSSIAQRIADFLKPQLVAAACLDACFDRPCPEDHSHICIVNMDSGDIVNTLCASVDQASILSLAWAPSGQHLAAGFLDRRVRIFNAESGVLVCDVKLGSEIDDSESEDETPQRNADISHDGLPIAYSPCGGYIAVGTWWGRVYILSAPDGATIGVADVRYEHGGGVLSVAYAPCGQHIAACSGINGHGAMTFFSAMDPKELLRTELLNPCPTYIAFSPCGRQFALGRGTWMGEVQGALHVIQVENGRPNDQVWERTFSLHVSSVTYSPCGQQLTLVVAMSPRRNFLMSFDSRSGAKLCTTHFFSRFGMQSRIQSAAYVPSGQYLAAGDNFGDLYIVSAATGKIIIKTRVVERGKGVVSVACAPGCNQRPVVSVGGECATIMDPVIEVVDHRGELAATRDPYLANEQVQQLWADDVAHIIQSSATRVEEVPEEFPESEQVFLYQYTRAPREFMNALLMGPDLKFIRDTMDAEQCPYFLSESAAKIFVWPHEYSTVISCLSKLDTPLRSSHVIVAESLLSYVEAALSSIPSLRNVRVKSKDILVVAEVAEKGQASDATAFEQVEGHDAAELRDSQYVYEVERTFICVVPVRRNAASVNQSTTEAHGGVNPRRFV